MFDTKFIYQNIFFFIKLSLFKFFIKNGWKIKKSCEVLWAIVFEVDGLFLKLKQFC